MEDRKVESFVQELSADEDAVDDAVGVEETVIVRVPIVVVRCRVVVGLAVVCPDAKLTARATTDINESAIKAILNDRPLKGQ